MWPYFWNRFQVLGALMSSWKHICEPRWLICPNPRMGLLAASALVQSIFRLRSVLRWIHATWEIEFAVRLALDPSPRILDSCVWKRTGMKWALPGIAYLGF